MVSAILISYWPCDYSQNLQVHSKRSEIWQSKPCLGGWPIRGWNFISLEVELVTFVGVMSEALCRSAANSEAPFPALCDSS